MAPADIVQQAVIGFADDGVYRADILIARLGERPFDGGGAGFGDIERVGEQDRRFHLPQFDDLGRSHEFAVRIIGDEAGRHLVLEEIAAMRQDRGDAGIDGAAAR